MMWKCWSRRSKKSHNTRQLHCLEYLLSERDGSSDGNRDTAPGLDGPATDVGTSGTLHPDQDCYDMTGERHAFLLCVKKGREGAEEDCKKVKNLLESFKFCLESCIDPKNEEITSSFEKFHKKISKIPNISCAFICIMAHGDGNNIFGVDGNPGVDLEEIFSMFDNEKCRSLQLKPKIFVIQACRGDEVDNGVRFQGFRSMNTEDEEPVLKSLPTISDTFRVYPAQPGFVAYRNTVVGSKMFIHMEKVFRDHWRTLHLSDLFVKVNQKMIKEEFQKTATKTTLMMESTLTKAVYLTQ